MDSLAKLDPVAANRIWSDRLKLERKSIRVNEDFRINPKLLKKNRISDPPHRTDPGKMIAAAENVNRDAAMSEEDKELTDSIFKSAKPPQEKFRWPMTAGQAIGWDWKDAAEHRAVEKKWLATHAQSELVKYNENYVLAFGKSPFAR